MILCSIKKATFIGLLILLVVVQSSVALNMKVYPVPRKRNITIQFGTEGGNPVLETQALLGIVSKKLWRLPYVFNRVLKLPFRVDANMVVEKAPNYFRFVAETEGIGEVRAHKVEIHTGMTKIAVRDDKSLELSLDCARARHVDYRYDIVNVTTFSHG